MYGARQAARRVGPGPGRDPRRRGDRPGPRSDQTQVRADGQRDGEPEPAASRRERHGRHPPDALTFTRPVTGTSATRKRGARCAVRMFDVASVSDTLRRDLPLQQRANLRLAITTVAAKSADCAKFARLRPPGHGLRVDSEHRRYLCRRQKRLGFMRTRCHRSLLHCYPITKAGVPAGRRFLMVRLVPDVRHGPNGWRSLYGWMMN